MYDIKFGICRNRLTLTHNSYIVVIALNLSTARTRSLVLNLCKNPVNRNEEYITIKLWLSYIVHQVNIEEKTDRLLLDEFFSFLTRTPARIYESLTVWHVLKKTLLTCHHVIASYRGCFCIYLCTLTQELMGWVLM